MRHVRAPAPGKGAGRAGGCAFSDGVARGVGAGAYESARRAGLRPIVTDEPTIEGAVRRLLDGTIEDHVERLH